MTENPRDCVCFTLRKAARAVTQMYDEALRPTGLRATQFSVLAALADAGGATMTELADALVMDRTTLTRNLKPLIERRLVETVRDADRRRRPVAVTATGRAALRRALPLWRKAQARTVDGLQARRWSGLAHDLGTLVALSRR